MTYQNRFANARGSVLSRNREGAVLFEYVTVFTKPCT
jgi:hypothetical protein